MVDFHGKCRELYLPYMDGMWYILTMVSKPPKWGWSISRWLGLTPSFRPQKILLDSSIDDLQVSDRKRSVAMYLKINKYLGRRFDGRSVSVPLKSLNSFDVFRFVYFLDSFKIQKIDIVGVKNKPNRKIGHGYFNAIFFVRRV